MVPQYEITFPYFEIGQKAWEVYARRRLVGYVARRQYLARRAHARQLFRGVLTYSVCRGFIN